MNNSTDSVVTSEETVATAAELTPIVKRAVPKTRVVQKPRPAASVGSDVKRVVKPKTSLKQTATASEDSLVVDQGPSVTLADAIKDDQKKKAKKADHKKAAKRITFCKMVKNDYLKKHFADYLDLVKNPTFVCKKCGRTANDPKYLCKPRSIIQHQTADTTNIG